MNIWPANITKPITIIAKETASINVYKRLKETNDPYAALQGTIEYMGNDTWELPATFDVGEYILKIVIIDNGITIPIYLNLSVKTIEEVNLTINQEIIKDQLVELDKRIASTNSWKAIG